MLGIMMVVMTGRTKFLLSGLKNSKHKVSITFVGLFLEYKVKV